MSFQADASDQGRRFDGLARYLLRDVGFKVSEAPFAVPELGIEVDAEAVASSGRIFWCEFKGSWRGARPGLRRTDSMKKALCDAFLVWLDEGEHPPLVLLTSHAPQPDSRGAQMLAIALAAGAVLGCFNINDPGDVARLGYLAKE